MKKQLITLLIPITATMAMPQFAHAESDFGLPTKEDTAQIPAALNPTPVQDSLTEGDTNSNDSQTLAPVEDAKVTPVNIQVPGIAEKISKTLLSVGNIFDVSPEGPLYKAWQQLRLSGSVGLINKSISISDSASASFGLHYRPTVQPAFIKDYQQRLDQYSANFGISDAIANHVGLGANIGVQLTFSRLIPGGKQKADFALPYLPNKIPWDGPTALKELNEGDVVRLELSSGANIGPSNQFLENGIKLRVDAGASVNRSAQMVLDIYRMKDKLVRMRLVAVRHQMDGGFSLTLNPINLLDHGSGLITQLLDKILSIRPLSIGGSRTLTTGLPVSTFMVDYVFNLANPDAASAFEHTMHQIHRVRVFQFLNFQSATSTIDDRVETFIKNPEILSKRDANLPVEERAVNRIFKGTTLTAFHSFFVQSQLKMILPVWNKRIDYNNSISQVRGFDQSDKPIDMLYLTRTSVDNFQGLINKWQTLENNSAEALFKAIPEGEKVIASDLSDMVLTKNLDDKNLSQRQFLRAKSFVELTIPVVSDLLPRVDFSAAKKVTNGFYRFKLVIHPEALSVMQRVSTTEVSNRLVSLIRNDPFAGEINSIHVGQQQHGPHATSSTSTNPVEKLKLDITDVANLFAVLLDDGASMNDKYVVYSQLREIELFQELGPALMVSLIPSDKMASAVYAKVDIGGENLTTVNIKYGLKDTSDFFSSFQFMQSLINNRTFDLRLQLNNFGEFATLRTNTDQVCVGCDGFNATLQTLPQQSNSEPNVK